MAWVQAKVVILVVHGGPQGSGAVKHTYSSITAINTSVRDDKNVLKVRLERQQGATFR